MAHHLQSKLLAKSSLHSAIFFNPFSLGWESRNYDLLFTSVFTPNTHSEKLTFTDSNDRFPIPVCFALRLAFN